MKWKGSILTVWLIKIFWILNGSYLYWIESNKPGIIQVILIKKLEKDETVQTLINVKKIKFFLCSSWCYFFPLAIFGLCLACKWERGIKSSISGDRTIPLFMLGICYLKNMQAILLKTSKLMKTRKKNQKTVLQVKATFRFGISQSPYSTALIMNFVPWVEVSNIAFFHLSVSWRACPLRIPASKSGTHQDLEQANIESVFSTGILKLQNSRFRAEKLHGFC